MLQLRRHPIISSSTAVNTTSLPSSSSTVNATTTNATSPSPSPPSSSTTAVNTTSHVLFSSPSNPATSTTYGVNNYATSSPSSSDFPTFPNNGVDTDKAPAFLDAYWTNYLSSSSSVSSSAVKKEVGPGDGASTLAVVTCKCWKK